MCKDMELRVHLVHLTSNQIRRPGAQKVGNNVGEVGMDCAKKYRLCQARDSADLTSPYWHSLRPL